MLCHIHSKHVQIRYGQIESDSLLPIQYSIAFVIFFFLTTLSALKYISHVNVPQWYINKTKTSVSSENTVITFSAAILIVSVTIMTSVFPSLWIKLIFTLFKALVRKSINWTLLAVLRKTCICTISPNVEHVGHLTLCNKAPPSTYQLIMISDNW